MSNRVQTLQAALDHLKGGRFEQAAVLCDPLLSADAGDTDARFFLGVSLAARGRLEEAVSHLTRVVRDRPEHADARKELARMLVALGLIQVDRNRPDLAIPFFAQAMAADISNAGAAANLGNALASEGRFDEALAATADALRIAPADIDLHVNRSVTLLKAGRLLEGWSENEWRHKKQGREKLPPALKLPRLSALPEGLAGRTVVIYHEQGFGDTIQFLRYADGLSTAGATVIAWMPQELLRLVRGHRAIAECLTGNVTLPPFDFHCPVNSLPYVFDTTLGTIPAPVAYLQADPELAAAWTRELPVAPRRVGVVWAGEPRPYDPGAQALDRRRSLSPDLLAPLTAVSGLAFVSLQMGAARLRMAPGLHDPMSKVKDFADTAAIISNLDLVVSVDTAVAHLAGAMGKPVFLLDRYDNCWRWLSKRTDSPWYPALRIFRQPRMGDWTAPVAAAAEALEAFANG
jgi:tetratricopeptide (TPR) repeat protein